MALTDINFSKGEKQDFIVEIPSASYSGSLTDVLCGANDAQYLVNEIPAAEGEGNVFIITE